MEKTKLEIQQEILKNYFDQITNGCIQNSGLINVYHPILGTPWYLWSDGEKARYNLWWYLFNRHHPCNTILVLEYGHFLNLGSTGTPFHYREAIRLSPAFQSLGTPTHPAKTYFSKLSKIIFDALQGIQDSTLVIFLYPYLPIYQQGKEADERPLDLIELQKMAGPAISLLKKLPVKIIAGSKKVEKILILEKIKSQRLPERTLIALKKAILIKEKVRKERY